jgi:hypothetical protein
MGPSEDEHAAALTVFVLDALYPPVGGKLVEADVLVLDGSGPEPASRVISKVAAASKPVLCTAGRTSHGHLAIRLRQLTDPEEIAARSIRLAEEDEGQGFFSGLFQEFDHTPGSLVEVSSNTGGRMQIPLTGLRRWRRDYVVPAITQLEGSRPDSAALSKGIVYRVHVSGPVVRSEYTRR